MSVSATARFTVTIDVPLGTWSETESLAHLRVIAKREGIPKLRAGLAKVHFSIVGEPKLLTHMAGDE